MKYRIELRKNLLLFSIICLITIKVYPIQTNDSLLWLDSSIRSGKLSNGVSYYIKQLPDAAEKVNMGLVVKVGHNHEEPGEFAFAHIVEHLGFSAGKNISVEKSSKLFDEIGLKLGELNGQTGNNHTSYWMIVPGNNEKGIEVGLLWFEDIIWNLELTERNINRERIAVFNEANIHNIPTHLFSRYMERRMSGNVGELFGEEKNNHLKSFKPEVLVQFYKEWYRPDSFALVIVGDVKNIDNVEDLIRNRFSKAVTIENSTIKKSHYPKYLSEKPQFLKKPFPQRVEEPERMSATLNLFVRDEPEESKNLPDRFKNNLIKELFIKMINKRHKDNQEFYGVNFHVFTALGEPPYAMKSVISIFQGFDEEHLNNIIKGFVEIGQNGFSAREFNQSKHNFLQALRKQDTTRILYWKNGIISHYVSGEAFPVNKIDLEHSIVSNLTLDEFNVKVKDYLKDQPDDITLAAHTGHPVLSYSEKTIRKRFAEFDSLSLKPYTKPQVPKTLIDSLSLFRLNHTSYKEKMTQIPFGRKFELENGLSVILKSTSHSPTTTRGENQIYFQGFVRKGVSHFSEADFFSAMNAPSIVMNSGVGALDKFGLQRYLSASEYKGRVLPYIDNEEAGVKGISSIQDLETTLQLVNLYLSDPKFSDEAFQDWKNNQTKLLAIHQNLNIEDFLNAIKDSLMHQDFLPKGTIALKGLDYIDFKRVKAIYRNLFNNSQDLTFIFSGDFDEKAVLDLSRKYLGNLPSFGDHNSKQNFLPEIPVTPYSKKLFSTKPMELALVRLVYKPKQEISDFDWREEIKIEILRRSMTELLMRRLRYESVTGGTYYVSAGRYNSKSYNHHEVFLHFQCKPSDTEQLIAESKEVVNNLRKSGLEAKLFAKIRNEIMPKKNEPESHQVILKKMYDFERHGETWIDESKKRNFMKSLTPHDILLTAQKYLNDNPFEFIMLPNKCS